MGNRGVVKHICIVITARASLARVQTVIEAITERTMHVNPNTPLLSIVLAGSAAVTKYGDVAKDIRAFAPSVPIHCCAAFEPHGNDGSAIYTGMLIQELTTCFAYVGATHVVVIADRYETLAVSIAASYNGLHLTHLLGGERSGNIDDKVRFANTALANVHCTPTAQAYTTLYDQNRNRNRNTRRTGVHLTGCPSVDLALRAKMPTAEQLNITGIGPRFRPHEPYEMVLYHPCADDPFTPLDFLRTILDERGDCQTLWFWPNIDPGAEIIEKELRVAHAQHESILLYRHLPAEQFLGLLKGAACLIGNSSVGVREASILGTPVVNIGYRQQSRLTTKNVANISGVGLLADTMNAQIDHGPYKPDYTYGKGDAGKKIAEILCTL